MRIVTVATHPERYYPSLQDSCKKHNCRLDILGQGEGWQGFAWRYQKMRTYLNTVPSDEVVVFVDAFDVVILRDASEIEATFRAMNVPMLFSVEKPYANIVMRYMYRRMYKYTCQGHNLCAGLYMGYAGKMKAFLDDMVKKLKIADPRADDQVLLMQYTRECPNAFHLDKKSEIFLNIHGGTKWWPSFTYFLTDNNQYYRLTNGGQLVTLEGIRSCILHGPGGANMDETVDRLGYPKPIPVKQQEELIIYFIRSARHFVPYFRNEVIGSLIVLGFVLYWLKTLCC